MGARRLIPVLLVALATGCGGSSSPYELQASSLCRDFNEKAYAGHMKAERIARLFAGFGDKLAELSPPVEFGRTHEVLLGYARGAEKMFAVTPADAPKLSATGIVGGFLDDVPRVRRDLPDCADTLEGTHPKIEVIR